MTTGIFHHIATFLLFVATILLLIPSISSPVVNDLSLLKVSLTNGSTVTFGAWGHCITDAASTSSSKHDVCSGSHIGYSPAVIMSQVDGTVFNHGQTDTADDLTHAFVLHPIACILAFIAFLLALGAGVVGALFAAFMATLAWIVALIVMAIDFASFAIIKNGVNGDGTGSHASYGAAIWSTLVAMIVLFLGVILVVLTCCSKRLHSRSGNGKIEGGYSGRASTRRRWW